MARELRVWIGPACWLAAVLAGFSVWHAYEATPGRSAPPSPVSPPLPTDGSWSVVTFLHPHCPCSRAGLVELEWLVEAAPRDANVRVELVFVCPPAAPNGWERGRTWDAAAGLPWARVRVDRGGVEAGRSGARTSGHTVLTAPSGRVLFRGGVTTSRSGNGHRSIGRAMLARLAGEVEALEERPVFGCPLFDDDECLNAGVGGEQCQQP